MGFDRCVVFWWTNGKQKTIWMQNAAFPKHTLSDNAAVVFPDQEASFVQWFDTPADIANDLRGRAAHLHNSTHIAFAAWHIAHNDCHVAVFAPEACA